MVVIIFILAIIVLDVLTFLNSGTIIDFNIVWPLFIASFGFDHWLRNKNLTKIGMSVVYIGFFFLLMNIGLYDSSFFKYFIPGFIIIMMITYLLQNLTYTWKYGYVKSKSAKIKIYFTLFKSKSYAPNDEEFNGLIAINLFGGLDIDLTNVKLGTKNATVSIYSLCGESSVSLPRRLNVVVIPSTLFGDTTIQTKDKNDHFKRCIFVKTFSLLCSTDIQNKEIKYDD